MPVFSNVGVEAAPTPHPWIAPELRGKKLMASGAGLTHIYTTDARTLEEADWVYLQVVLIAYQIHPATVAELAALGPVGGENAKRWTIEGPLMHRPGDPGEQSNCTLLVEVAYSTTATPGSDWRPYKPGRYKLRSYQARLTITRPSVTYDFRVARFAAQADLVAQPMADRRTTRVFSRG